MKVGDLVHIAFLDHCHHQGGEKVGPMMCEVFGKIVGKDKTSYVVASWISDGVVDHNAELFVILRSTIKKERRLK